MDEDPIESAEALIAAGRGDEAAAALRARLAAGRGGLLVRLALVKALLSANDVAGALHEAREAASLNPNIAPALVALGEALLAAEALPAAIAELQRALRLDPDDTRARLLVAKAWLQAGEVDQAMDTLGALDDTPEAAALIAAADAMRSAPRSDPGYVRHLFDQFAPQYDSRMLDNLGYAAPAILAELAALVMAGRQRLRVLDLGCGTGLAGAAFRPLAARLDGIDLSPAMIERARARGIYDSLAVADLETALAADGPAYDLILAADTLVYLGELFAVFEGAARQLGPDGFFLFTVEAKTGEGFELGPKRRWRHSEHYLRDIAGRSSLAVAGLVACAPRTEANLPVEGFAVALTMMD